jgi:hypothetical protein
MHVFRQSAHSAANPAPENAWPGQHQACGAVKFLDSNPHDQWREQ